MALRQQTTINQENLNSRVSAKAAQVQLTKTSQARSALGEVGNKLPTITENEATKKLGTNRPVQAISKKPAVNLAKKDAVKKPIERILNTAGNKGLNLKKIEPAKDVIKTASDCNVSTSYSSKQFLIIDPDESSKNEPQMVTEYIADIYAHLRELENKHAVRQNFLKDHETTPRMRAVLINWLAEVSINFKLNIETFHLCVSIVDRYLQDSKTVGRSTLQLVGTAAMYVACKYEEMYIPELSDFVYICDDTFSARQILLTEMEILKKLDFSFGRPLSVHFLRRYNKIAQVKSEQHTLGKYILELALMEYEMSHIKPSLLAAATCCLSIGILNEIMDLTKVWTPTMVHYTTYKFLDFRNVMIEMAHMLVRVDSSKYQVIRLKYAGSAYGKISMDKRLSTGPLVKKLTSMFTPSKK